MALAEELLENDEADECSTLKRPVRIKWVTVVLPAGAWVSGRLLGLWAQLQRPLPWDNLEVRDAMRAPDYAYNTCAKRGCKVKVADDRELCDKHSAPGPGHRGLAAQHVGRQHGGSGMVNRARQAQRLTVGTTPLAPSRFIGGLTRRLPMRGRIRAGLHAGSRRRGRS